MRPNIVLSLFGFAGLVTLTAAQTQSNSNCTVFNWDRQPGYLINGTAVRVSAAATCNLKGNATHECPITATGDQDASFSYNISSVLPDGFWNDDSGGQSFIHNLILNAVNSSLDGQGWDNYVIGVVDTTQGLPPNTSGYINLIPLRRCFEGTMSNCTGGLEDGLPIRACAPVYTPIRDVDNSLPILDGTYSVVEIPRGDVGNYRDPYGGESRGEAGRNVNRAGLAMMASLLTIVFAISLW